MKALKEKKQFRKDLQKANSSGKNLAILYPIIATLYEENPLDPKYGDHPLVGNWNGCRELHIQPNWLLIYKIEDEVLILERTGSHSELFGK